jgi:hypothetical protein
VFVRDHLDRTATQTVTVTVLSGQVGCDALAVFG